MDWKDLEITQKTTKIYELLFTKNGLAIDITDWTIFYTVKENMKDSDNNAKITKDVTTHDDPTNGKTTIDLSTSDTDLTPKTYWYDVTYKDDEGNVGVLYRGRLKIIKPVTVRRS